MECFLNAASIRLRSHNGRYLTAAEDEKSVIHRTDGTARAACWSVEHVHDSLGVVRLRSYVGLLLTASHHRFLLGTAGFKVLQTSRNRNNASVEWQPIREGGTRCLRLRTRCGTFLRGNGGGLPPYKGSVTHDRPVLAYARTWVLWQAEVVEPSCAASPPRSITWVSPSAESDRARWDSEPSTPERQIREESGRMEKKGRTIHYQVVGEKEEMMRGSLLFEGSNVQELARKIEDHTGIPNVILCAAQDAANLSKLHRIRLALPPRRLSMSVFVVPSSSSVAKSLEM